MPNQQLLEYVKQQLKEGVSREQIKSLLLANNWQEADINAAFNVIAGNTAPMPESQTPRQITGTLPGVTALLGQAWSLYKQRFATFLGIMIVPILVSMALVAMLVISIGSEKGRIFLAEKLAGSSIEVLLLMLGALVLFSFAVIFIGQSWGQTSLLFAIKDSSEEIGVWEAYRRGWHKLYSYWWITLLMGFIILGGFLLFIIPGIIFAVWFSMAMFILIAEDLKGMDALLKSREYVRGRWGDVLWRLFFVSIFSFIPSIASTFVFKSLNIPFVETLGSFVLTILMTPLILTYLFLLYSNLQARKSDASFVSTGGKKAAFIFVGILGMLIIPAIIAFVIFSSLGMARAKSRDSIRQHDIGTIQVALEMYYGDHSGTYPSTLNELPQEYLSSTLDPVTKQPYQYQLQAGGKNYEVCAQLESPKTQKCVSSQF